jgi:hypothetical protein
MRDITRIVRGITLAAGIAGDGAAHAATAPWQWLGTGVQRYACAAGHDGAAWHLLGPDAVLTDAHGVARGHHTVGPSWKATDGSRIVGAVLQTIPAPVPGAVPWLVLAARTHTGHGIMDDVAFILRIDTRGGQAPATGCGAATLGATADIRYRATYVFVPARARLQP